VPPAESARARREVQVASLSELAHRGATKTLGLALLAALALSGCSFSVSIGDTGAPVQTPGTIVFGTSVDTTTWHVANASTTFKTAESVGWAAALTGPANSPTLTFTLSAVDSQGNETVIDTETIPVSDQSDDVFVHRADNTLGTLGPGKYSMRYSRPSDGTLLASGVVTITK
jgi:hypothetical protein